MDLNHRKRKADNDDCSDPASVLRPDPPAPVPCSVTVTAPRQPCLASDDQDSLWNQSSNTENLPKRPRLEKLRIANPRKHSRRSPVKLSPTRFRQGTDLPDIGIVPGPSTPSLLRDRTASAPVSPVLRPCPLIVSFDLTTLPIPPPQPLINRQTLKELDLDSILRNPQLRHDLLFDPGLQFRPTASKRKRDVSDRYWAAIEQDVEHGCTCFTFDSRRKPHPLVCICGETSSYAPPAARQVGQDLYTVRIPSRVPSLLTEFLEVLLLVIQPLCSISGIYVNPNTFKVQMQEHSAQAAYIRSIFDSALIEQELRHNMFDPSALFRTIGETLKGHCAPMRDRSVEDMIRVAEQCGSSSKGSSKDAISAIRMCMEILELMKLDIANHQLQTLRPFLLRTSGQFELRTLKGRHGLDPSFQATRAWIEEAHLALLRSPPALPRLLLGKSSNYASLSTNQQLYVSVLKGIVDLVFNPPLPFPKATSPTSAPNTPTSPSLSPTSLIPETLYLDNARLLLLSSDAADTTAIYMLLLLFRQMVFSDESNSNQPPPQLTQESLATIKREIRDVAGNQRLGRCFSRNFDRNGKEAEAWRVVKEDVVLQVAKRANDARTAPLSPSNASTSLSSSSSTTTSPSPLPSSTTSCTSSRIGNSVDERFLEISRKWADVNLLAGSSLSTMIHNRLRDAVFNAVLVAAFPGRDLAGGCRPVILDFAPQGPTGHVKSTTAASGMAPLADEIRTLSEKIALLALVHLNAYLPMYENEGFAPSSAA